MATLKQKEYQKEYYLAHREEKLKKVKKYYSTHKRDCPKYYLEHKEKLLETTRNSEKRKEEKYGIGIHTIYRYGLKTALEIYDKYNRKCSKCGNENNLTIHHIDHKGRNYERMGLTPNNNIDNLIILCNRCHGSIHGGQSKGKHLKPFTEEHKKHLSEGAKRRYYKSKYLTETK